LHLKTLETMVAFTGRYSAQFQSQLQMIYDELTPLIDENDLMKASLAIKVCTNLMKNIGPQGGRNVTKATAHFAGSELIQAGSDAHHTLG